MVRTGTFTAALLVWTNLRQCTMCSRWLFCFLPLRLCLNGKLVSQTTETGEWIYCIYSMKLFTPWHRRQGLQWWQKKNTGGLSFVAQTGRVQRVRSTGAAPRERTTASNLEGAWPVSAPASPTCSTSPAQLRSPAWSDAPVLPGERMWRDTAWCHWAFAVTITQLCLCFD